MTHDGCSRVTVVGVLDANAANQVAAACDGAMAESKLGRLELDLTRVTGATPEGIGAISDCFALSRTLAGGVRVIVSSDVGRRAMLNSMTAF